MLSGDFRYRLKNFETRGEIIWMNLSNTEQYNAFTGQDLGQSAYGYYAEIGYNMGPLLRSKNRVVPFIRYSNYDTHQRVSSSQMANKGYQKSIYTTGLSWFINPNFVVKGDYQRVTDGTDATVNTINLGVGYWFR